MKKYKIVFLDLDDTLINTLNNEPFPRGVWDMDNKCVCKGSYTCENDKNNRYRKPNIGMLEYLLINSTFNKDYPISKKDICMIGDALGKEGQFSDSDKQTAINFGIDYYDVDDFIKMEL